MVPPADDLSSPAGIWKFLHMQWKAWEPATIRNIIESKIFRCGHGPASRWFVEPSRNWDPPTHAMRGPGARRQSKYNEIKDILLWAHAPASWWIVEPSQDFQFPTHAMRGLGARRQSKYNRIKDYPLRAWSRRPMICQAQPKLESSYTRSERLESPSPSPSSSQFLAGQLPADTTTVKY